MDTEIAAYYRQSTEQLKYLRRILKQNNILVDDVKPVNITPKKLVGLVEDVFEVNVKANNRQKTTIFGRQAAAYILKNNTRLSLKEIALEIGVTDHSTVLYHIRKCQDFIILEDWYKNKIDIINEEIKKFHVFTKK